MTSNIKTAKPERRRELDMMGMLIVVGLVFFHTAQIFGGGDFYVQNEPPSMVALAFVAFASLWGMPLMFLMAGTAIWYSLRKRSVGEFVRERFRRLFVPFVVGLPLLVPPQVYTMLKGDPTYQESYLQFFPRFFHVRFTLSEFPLFIEGAPPDELFRISILYFLIFLFVYTLLLLPLFLHLQKPAGRRLVERLATVFSRPAAIYLLALPMAVIEAMLGTESPGAWNRFAWVPFIVYGFLFACDGRFERALGRHWKSALILGVFAFAAWMTGMGYQIQVLEVDPLMNYGPVGVLTRFLKGMASWFWVVAIMGLAGRGSRPRARQERNVESGRDAHPRPPRTKSTFMDRVAEYAQDARLPFYVLHQTPIVVIGFYVVQWEVSALVKYLVICLSSLVVTLVVYDIGVRRTRLTRFLFGMRPRQKAPETPASEGGVYAN